MKHKIKEILNIFMWMCWSMSKVSDEVIFVVVVHAVAASHVVTAKILKRAPHSGNTKNVKVLYIVGKPMVYPTEWHHLRRRRGRR